VPPTRASPARADGRFNRWFLDPLYGRHYPADVVAGYAAALPNGLEFVLPGDLDAIATPTDFLGLNYYSRRVARDEDGGR
jgi:beta-glucosidase